jgi:uncharacterized phage protein (TIGR02218 family)
MPITEEMKAHLQGNTSLACFLTIIARDETALRVWNGTRNKILDGEIYYAFPITPSQLQSSNGLKPDNLEAQVIFGGLWNAASLRAKKWLGARVEYAVYDYKNFELGFCERRVGFLGETKVGRFAASPELKSLSNKLSEPIGFTYASECNVITFGDNRCGVDAVSGMTVTGYKNRANASVIAPVLNKQQFSIQFDEAVKPSDSGITAVPDMFYENGKIKFITGANAGDEMQILGNTGNALTLFLPVYYPVAAGDQIQLTVGCNRSIAVCRDLHGNGINNRSYFMLPGRRKFAFPE